MNQAAAKEARSSTRHAEGKHTAVLKSSFCCFQMWILAAQFEVRQLRLDAARRILGMSLGMCPKDRTYKAYIEVSSAGSLKHDMAAVVSSHHFC